MMDENKATPNHKIRYEREKRSWSQQELADTIGTTALNISRWERGITQPGPHFRHQLCEIFEKTAEQLDLVVEKVNSKASSPLPPEAAPPLPAQALLWNIPYRRNIFFTGREETLAHLRTALLSEEQPVALAQPQAISGLGGIGKTQTALEYAYRFRSSYQSVFWARADSYDLLASDFLTIAALLHLPQHNEQEQQKIINAVLHWFDTHEGWLLILDNADHLDVVSNFIPSAGKGHVLLTTRAYSTGTIAERIELEKMSLQEATQFLLKRIKQLKGATTLDHIASPLLAQAQTIAEMVDGLPLALDQAGAYIEETGCSLSDYLRFYKTRRTRLLRARGKDAAGHPEPVATTWSLSFERVEQTSPVAAELLKLCAFLHPDAIPESMLMEGASELGTVLGPILEDELDLNDAIGVLHRYSLIKRDSNEKMLNIHRLVQVVVKDSMKAEEEREWVNRVVHMMAKAYPEGSEFVTWDMCQKYLPHALVCAEFIETWKAGYNDASLLLSHVGAYLCTRARYKEAETLLQNALTIQEQTTAPEDTLIAEILNSQGIVHWMQGHYERTVALLQRAILIQEATIGPMHTKLAESLNNLGVLYNAQGKRIEAIALYERAIAMWQQVLSPDDAIIAYAITNLAVVYDDLGRYGEAEQLYKRALDLRLRLQGEEHPEMATIFNNLAVLYRNLKRYEEALPLQEKALILVKNTMGAEHPRVGASLDNLARSYQYLGMHEKAEETFKEALTLRRRTLKAGHVDIAPSLQGLATLYRLQGKHDLVEPLLLEALAIREQALGQEHDLVAQLLHGLALHYTDRERFEEAEPLYLRALAIQEQKLGTNHPDVATTLEDYAALLRKTKRENEAPKLEEQAQNVRARRDGENIAR